MANPGVQQIVQRWIDQTAGLIRLKSTEDGAVEISESELLELASSCECAEITDRSSLSIPGMHHSGLVIWSGDFVEYCQSEGQSELSKVYFMSAYRVVEHAIQQWLDETTGFAPHISTETGADPISFDELMKLASGCEWVKVDDTSYMPNAHPKGLVIGTGDLLSYCTSSGRAGGQAHFLTAYCNQS